MIKSLTPLIAAMCLMAGIARSATLDEVKARGVLTCGVSTGLTGFAAPDAKGVYQGFDAALCKAVAAAVLGDGAKVRYVPTTMTDAFAALTSGRVDLLARNVSWTFLHDADLSLDFVAVSYYDGQGFMVKKDLGVSSARELDGARICLQTGTSTEANLTDYFKANSIKYSPVLVADEAEAQSQFLGGTCDAMTTEVSVLAALRATFLRPDDYVILPEIISKEPLGPVVRHGDNAWGDIVRWTYFALLAAEEKGITQDNIDEVAMATKDPEVRRMLGLQGDMGLMLGLDPDWAKRAIAASGNYAEIFESNIGITTPVKLARGLNALWTQGGLQYAPPFR
jgi:general L-amino acid transport system substrate-binding protein